MLAGAILSALWMTVPLHAEDTNTVELIKQLQKRIEDLEQKVKTLEQEKGTGAGGPDTQTRQRFEELDQKVKVIEHDRELEAEAAAAKAREAPKLKVDDEGFSIASANGDFVLQLREVLQVDSRTFFNDSGIVGNDALLLRRARPILQGTVFRDVDYLLVPDFAGSTPQIFDAYLNYRFLPELQLQAGKFKAPVGLEQLQEDRYIFFNERALPTDLVPNRDLGFELHGDLFKGVVSYAAGVFNGVGDARLSNNTSFQNDKSFDGRLFFQPFKPTSLRPLQGFGFGMSGSFESEQAPNASALPATTGGALPGFATVGQQQFFAYNSDVLAFGDHWRLSPQGSYFYGPFDLLWEYVISDQEVTTSGAAPLHTARLENTGWQVAGGWVLTGEDVTYSGVVPRHPFNPFHGDWGALQLLGRCSALDVDSAAFSHSYFANPAASASAAREWSVGLNWYLNRNVRVGASFAHTTFDGGGTGASAVGLVTHKDENVLFTRLQLAF
jgi:phosphate-selective porin OprO/OprP